MLPKCVARIGCPFLEVAGELQLFAQGLAALDCFSLVPLPVPDRLCGRKQLFGAISGDEETTVIIGENNIARFHLTLPEERATKR